MSLIRRVAELVRQHQELSTWELIHHIKDADRQKIIKAAQNAAHIGLIRKVGNVDRQAGIKGQGAAIWAPGRRPGIDLDGAAHPRPVSSVWELAQRG